MRIILFIVFYIATYVARIAIGGDIAKTMSGNSMKYIFKPKNGATRNRVSEILNNDDIIQTINKRNRQSLQENRIGFPQSRKILNSNLKRIKRSLRKRKKHAKNSNDINEDGISNVERFPIWRVPESMVATINLDSTTNPSIVETEMITRSLDAIARSQLENLDYDRSANETNSRGLLDLNASNKNLILSKIANPKSEIKIDVRTPTFEGLDNKMLHPAYRPEILADVDLLSSSRPRGFQWRYRHQRDSTNSHNVKEELFNDRPIGSNKRFLLVPVSKDLYVLKNIRESPRTVVDGIIVPKRYKLLERDKDSATSAILSFKAHMHHDVKDVGRAYIQRGNHRLFDHNANYLDPTLDPRVSEESANPVENLVPPSYPDFLYPGIALQTDPNLNATPEISEPVISPVSDYENISFAEVINSRGGINSYDSSPSSFDILNYNVCSKENANVGQSSILSTTKLNNEINQQDSGNYGNSLGYSEFDVELTTADFRDTLVLNDNINTSAALENVEMYLTNNDKEVVDMSRSREDDSKFLTGSNEDKFTIDFIDDISTQYSPAFDASANEDNIFFPNITYAFVNNAILKSEDVDKDNREYGISISEIEYSNKKSTHSIDFNYDNRAIDEASFSNYTTEIDSFLNAEDYVTSVPLILNTDEWSLKKAKSTVENSNALLMAIKPLSSELQKLLSAIQVVNQSISDVQNRLCDKKNDVERKSKDTKATNIAKLIDRVDHYDFDLSTKSFDSQSLDRRRIKAKNKNVPERVKIRKKTDGFFLNKLTTPFRKRDSNSEVRSGRRNFIKKRKLIDGKFLKSGNVEGRRLPHSRFNRNLKSLTKNYETRVKPFRQLTDSESKRMKRTTRPIIKLLRLSDSDVPSESNFAEGRAQYYEGNDQTSRSIISPNNMPFLDISMKKDSSAHLLSDNKRDLMQRDVKRATSGEISGKETKFHPTDPQFYKEATAYHDILRLLGKTEKPHVEYATDVLWTTQNLTESLPPLIFTTTEVSLSMLTFLPYFTEAPIITTTENFTTESVMLLTPFLEGMTDITLKITIPVATIISIEETPVSLYAEIVTTEEEAVEGTTTSLATEITRSPLVETTVSLYLYTLSTVSLFGTTETELTIKTTTEPVSTFFATTTSPQTATLESIFGENITLYKAESTTAIARSSTILEKTETILSTSTEGMATTLTPEDESPVAQIEKTITAEETATEIPTTTETLPTEITITTIITTEISTAATEIPTTVEATTITKTSIPTEILTTLKTPVTKEITSAKTLTPTETLTPFKTKTTAQILTSIKTTIFTEILTVNKTVTAGTPTSLETPTASEIPPTSTILTTTKTLETLTTTKIPVKKTTSTLTPTIMEISTESLGTTEISVITTTYVTTKFFTTSESTLSIPTTPKEFFPMSTLTTFTTIFITETTESTLISSITPVSTISAKTAVPTLKLATITPLQTLITNTTLSETPYTTISSTFLTTTKGPVTITFKTAVPTTFIQPQSLKIITTTPLSLATSTMPGETPNTTLSTFLTEETTASSILTTAASSLETFQTTAVLSIPTTVSTIETVLTTLSITAVNATVSSTTASTITTEIFESTISSLIYFTATTPITTSILMETETTLYPTTSTSVTSSFLTETTEGTTSPIIEYKETTKYEEYYYESTEKEIVTVTISTAELTSEERTTWITAKEITIIEETTPMTSFITPFFIETTTPLVIETITLPTITEETLLIEKIVTPIIEEISTVSEVILISTETSTMSAIETSIRSTSFILTTAATTASLLEKIATEITETSLKMTATLPTTEKPEYATILEAAIAVPLAPSSESILSIIITSETPVTTPEIISTLPEIVSEEFTTESPSITYVTKSSVTLFIETTVHSTVAISIATTEKMLEAETEYYVAKEPFYKEEYEEYEEYDTEVPTGKWYDYEYESTTEKGTTVAVKYTKLPKEKATSPPFIKGATSSYETETSEFTRYSTVFETTSTTLTTSTYINVTSTAATSEIFYTEEVTSTALETSASTFVSTTVENVTTLEVKTKFTTSAASEEVESTTISLTFGSTEEYTLPSSTTFKIPTEPLEYLTIPPKYTDLERFTHIWRVTSPKFTTKPKKIPEIALKKTTASERVSTETEETAVEKLTSVFVSSAVTTLSEREAFVAGVTTMSTSEIEGIIETIYEVTTSAMTEEEAVTRVTPFITTEIELVFTTTSETVAREEKEQLLQRLDDLRKHEKEMAEREEWLKEKERQWDVEKEKRRKMMQREKEKEKNITTAGTTEGYVTTIITTSITSPVYTVAKNLTISTAEIEVTSSSLEMSTATSSLVEIPTETTPFSTTEEITFVTYTTTQKTTIEEIIFTTYATEETVIPYITEESTPIIYITEEIEKVQITEYVTLVPYVTTSIVELYNISLVSIETTTPYTIEEMHTTSYMTLYSEPLFASPTITSPITLVTEFTLPIATLSERFEEISLVTTPTWYTTEETYTETYTEIYSKPLFTSPALEFTSTTISSTLAIGTTQIKTITEIKYDEEIERLKEELREKERELEERKKILLEREERLERDIIEFERYVKEFEKKKTSITPLEKSTVLTSLSTPVPPTEKTTTKAQLTTQTKRVIEKKENRTTTKMVTSRYTEIKEIEEKKWTKPVFEKTVTQKEEDEIATKRICLNVLENTTIPLDKKRRNIVTKKICLPYFPEKNKEKESVGRLSRRLLALQNTKKIRRPRGNVLSNFRDRRRVKETTRKIDNLQLSYHEWLSNESTKPLQHFKGFTRIYKKMRKFRKNIATIIDTQRNTTSDFRGKIPLYERVLEHHESFFQPTATSMMDSKKYGKRNAFFRHNLIFARKSDLPIDDKANVRKRDVSPIENNAQFRSRISTANISNKKTTAIAEKNGAYTVNVLHLSYNEDKQTHEIISAKPDEDELTAILSESNDIYVTEFGEDRKITTPYYEIEEKDDERSDETEKRMEEDDEYIEDMIENYMNYEEHETSTRTHERFLDRSKDKRTTENERELLNQAWPTERSTTYHLGGTRFWELDFVTEPSVLRTTTKKSKTIGVSITRTTCFDVVLQNERNDEIKSNVFYRKRNIYNNGMKQHIPIKKRNVSLKNVSRNKINALRYKLKTKFYEPKVAKKLKRNSQKLHESNSYKRAFEEKGTVRFNDFWRTSNKDLITAKSRKLCVVNANKLKRQIVKHKDVTDKHKKKQKSQTSQNINLHILHNTDNCVVSTKNKYHKTTTKSLNQVKSTADKNEKVTHSNMIDHKNKSTSASHEKKIHNCFNCICDIVTVVNNIRSLLDRKNFPLDEIKTLNCSEYKDIQDKIVISMDADMEEAREFSQPHYNTESLKGQKYIKLEELEDNFKSDSELDSDHDVISLPGLNLNLPCNQDGNGITWLSSVSRPSYTWKRTDGIALFGFVAENGDLELRNVNAKDTGNYTCIMTYMSPDNEEPVETVYEIHLQVVTLPRYIVHGENRYRVRSCDEGDLDVLITYLPIKLNSVICEADVCNAYVLTPSCSRSQITINILLVPSHIIKLMTIDPKHCNVFCLKAIQDKLSLILSKNLQIFLGKTIIFRLPHYEQRLVPIVEKSSFARRKRGKTDANAFAGRSSNIGLFSSCPAGYGLRETRCVPCNVGTYSEDGISHCKRCPPGTFQPNHGARVCRTCTNPMTKGCYNMLWNSFSAVMVTLASVGAMLSICLLLVWIICCAKKKFFVKRIAGLTVKQDMFEEKHPMEEQPLIKDASENEDQQWDSEYIVKKKKGKFHVNKKRRKQNESRKYDKAHLHEDEWGSHRIKNAPVISPDSYRSHEDYNNHYLKRSHRKGPRLPECDFDT